MVFALAVSIGDRFRQEGVGTAADLLRRAIVELHPPGAAPHVDAEGQPGDLRLVDALALVTAEKQVIVVRLAQRA